MGDAHGARHLQPIKMIRKRPKSLSPISDPQLASTPSLPSPVTTTPPPPSPPPMPTPDRPGGAMRRHTTTSSIFEHSEEAIPRKRAALNESDSAGEMLPHPPHPCNAKSILRKRRRTSERASSRPRASEAGHTRSEQHCQGRRLVPLLIWHRQCSRNSTVWNSD